MKRRISIVLLIIVLLTAAVFILENPAEGGAIAVPAAEQPYDVTLKQDLLCLMLAYPEHIAGVEKTDNGVYLVMKSGQKLIYDDKKAKNPEQKLANPDLQDMLEQAYPLGAVDKLMEKDYDPGRARVYALLKEVYGSSQSKVQAQLTNVRVGGRTYQFNKGNKASEALKAVMEELIPLAQKNGKVAGAAFPCNGTFNYRYISNTNRLSPHAFGIAIDLARDKRDYWQWASREEGQKRLESYPRELVEVFERNNFVWGGKWGHFDILHFEYRPEIILKARYFGRSSVTEEWYKGAPIEDALVGECIDKIEEALK